jgi:hypothetical protein
MMGENHISNVEIKEKIADSKRRNQIDSKYATDHVGHKRWEIISKNIGEEIETWKSLFNIGKKNLITNDSGSSTGKLYCGEELYLSIRPILISNSIICGEKLSKQNDNKKISSAPKGKKINKADKIRQDNIAKKIKIDIDALLKSGTSEPIVKGRSIIFKSKFVEMTMIRMMIQCKNLILQLQTTIKKFETKSKSKYTPKEELDELNKNIKVQKNEIYELIVGYNKIISQKKYDPKISTTCTDDLIKWVTYAKNITNFDATEIIVRIPELLFKTIYDGMLQGQITDLYQSQKNIFNFVTQNDKFLALVHTMLGSGKTSMILPLCGWLSSQPKIKTKILFCCPNEIVLLEVARMIYGMGISFAIIIRNPIDGSLDYKWSSFAEKVKIKGCISCNLNHRNEPCCDNCRRCTAYKPCCSKCKIIADKIASESATIYLCDIYVARILLEERMECIRCNETVPDYILIGDELTMNADSQNGHQINTGFSVMTEVFVDIMKIAPPKIVLMSATLPTSDQLPHFYGGIAAMHPGIIVRSFSSSEAKIGCALISSNGELYAPHIGCQTIGEIVHILNVIKSNPFIGRFYTFEVLLEMVENFKKIGLSVPDLAIMFDDPSKANQTSIQQTAYIMLESLIATGSDLLVLTASQSKKIIGKGVNLNTILTSDIGRFNKGCLIFSSDPVATAFKVYKANFDKFIDPNAERNIFEQVRLDTIITKYERELESWSKTMKRFDKKSDPGIIKQNKENNKKERPKLEPWQASAKLLEEKPVWQFPPAIQLCSVEHLKKVKYNGSVGSGGTIGPDDLPTDTTVSMDILTMLASGIGIYTTNTLVLDDEYLKTVILLAKKGLIKTIFTDGSIAYGTNLAVSDIVIMDEPVCSNNGEIVESIDDKHSMKTIFQMLGRAGRGGNLSYQARIYTTNPNDKLINKIRSYTLGTLDEGPKNEIQNIQKAYETLW